MSGINPVFFLTNRIKIGSKRNMRIKIGYWDMSEDAYRRLVSAQTLLYIMERMGNFRCMVKVDLENVKIYNDIYSISIPINDLPIRVRMDFIKYGRPIIPKLV